eukprot:scaffold12826_cov75-Skeletonema_dohrnii-CCMP3373.AAC.4
MTPRVHLPPRKIVFGHHTVKVTTSSAYPPETEPPSIAKIRKYVVVCLCQLYLSRVVECMLTQLSDRSPCIMKREAVKRATITPACAHVSSFFIILPDEPSDIAKGRLASVASYYY